MARTPGRGGSGTGRGKGTATRSGKPVLRLVAQGDAETGEDRPETATGPALVGEVMPVRKPKTRGPVLPIGVTAKEEAFCRQVVAGLSQSEAYRRSHDADGMAQESIHAQAVKIATRDRVRLRIDQLIAEGQANALHDRRRALAWALDRLQREAETAETDGARVAAVSLIMRHHALLTDRQEVETKDTRDSQALETELRQKLERLLKTGT